MAQIQIPALPVAASVADSDIAPLQQSGVTRGATAALIREPLRRKDEEVVGYIRIEAPAAATLTMIDLNRSIGTVVGVDARMVAGSCTTTWQIADQDGSAATNITGLSSIAVTTTRRSDTATAANVMLKTGSTDRQLVLVLSAVSGVGPLLMGLRLKGT